VNTTQRLALIFGSQASFEIKQESQEVVCAQVILPANPSLEPTRRETKKGKPKPAGLEH
jgi:hypothetical protein